MSADLVRKNKIEKVGRGRTMRLLLKILWGPYCSGALSGGALDTAAFTARREAARSSPDGYRETISMLSAKP